MNLNTENQPLRWYEVWQQVWLHPSAASFERVLADPALKSYTAFVWAAVTGLIAGLLQGLFQPLTTPEISRGVMLAFTLVCGPLGGVIGLAIGAGIYHVIALLFGGTGTYERLVYALGAITAPSILLSSLVSIPQGMLASAAGERASILIACLVLPLTLALAIYSFILYVNAVRAAENLTMGKAVLVVALPSIAAVILAFLAVLILVPVAINLR